MNYLLVLLLFVLTAVLVHSSGVFTIVYLFTGALVLGRWWSERSLRALQLEHEWLPRAFLGEEVPVRLRIRNTSILPVGWLHIHESIPPELAAPNLVNQVVSIAPHGTATIDYTLQALKRGYYKLGPLYVSTGDLFGLNPEERRKADDAYLTVFPRIVPFTRVGLPSRSPMGTLRHTRPIFEDPTRVLGKREYVPGDSLRRVDWKATAASGRLQVKQFEPAVALETLIFLNLNGLEYPSNARLDATELGIVIAASLANWIIRQRQAVGLITNGLDPLSPAHERTVVSARKGRGHLMRILDVLARLQMGDTTSLAHLVQRETPLLPWGTTVTLITGLVEDALFDELFQVRRRGLDVVLILAGRIPGVTDMKKRAESFGICVHGFQTESDLDAWRQ
ncbi:MAG: DUF58 domain-containing protein [Chloroflexota bacterium]